MTNMDAGAAESRPIERLIRPFQTFAAREASGGILLLLATLIALAWANSPWSDNYFALWHTPTSFRVGEFTLTRDLHFWVNDALMTLFFFLVGLEIKRELLVGELAMPRQAALLCGRAAVGRFEAEKEDKKIVPEY